MKSLIILILIIGIIYPLANYSYGQHEEVEEDAEVETREVEKEERILVIREAKLFREKNVAVDAQLIDDVLEIMVEARIYAQKPRINDVLVRGPKLGRLHYQTRKTIVAGVDEPEPFEVTKEHGWLVLGKRKKVIELEGTLTKELFKIKIPEDKIVCGKKYELWVEIESKTRGGRAEKFKFKLEDFPELIRNDCSSK